MKEIKIYNNKSIIIYFFILTNILGFIAFFCGSAITGGWLEFGLFFLFIFLISFVVFIIFSKKNNVIFRF